MKIIFFGTPKFVDPVLKSLEERFDVIKAVRSAQDWNKEIPQLKKLDPDFFVVASFGQILPQEILEIPKIASINIHPSLLPKYRGPTPIQSAILNNDQKTGVSIIKMDTQVDHGPILSQIEEMINEDDTFDSLSRKLFIKSIDPLIQVLSSYAEIKPKIQDESKASFTKMLSKQNGFIDIGKPIDSSLVKRMIRAYFPWPGAWTKFTLSGDKELIIKFLPDKKIQVEGKREASYSDFINGYARGKELLDKLGLS